MNSFGETLKAERERRGLALRAIAPKLLMSYTVLSRIESGKYKVPSKFPKEADTFFGTGKLFQDLYARTERENERENEPADIAPDDALIVPGVGPDGERTIFMPTSRRKFLKGIGTGIIAAGTAAPAVTPLPAAADLPPIERLRRVRKTLIEQDNQFGPWDVIGQAERYVRTIQAGRSQLRGDDRVAALREQAQFAEFLGWLYQDAGLHDQTRFWTDRAVEWGSVVGDHDLRIFLLARRAQAAMDAGDADGVIDHADAAIREAGTGSRLAGIAATFGAVGWAMAGDGDQANRYRDHAHELLTDMDHQDPWGVWFGETYIDAHYAQALSTLKQYDRAAEYYQTVTTQDDDDFHRDHGVYLARAALAHSGARDTEAAANTGMKALSIGVETRSGRIINDLLKVENRLAEAGPSPAASTFRTAMRETVIRKQR